VNLLKKVAKVLKSKLNGSSEPISSDTGVNYVGLDRCETSDYTAVMQIEANKPVYRVDKKGYLLAAATPDPEVVVALISDKEYSEDNNNQTSTAATLFELLQKKGIPVTGTICKKLDWSRIEKLDYFYDHIKRTTCFYCILKKEATE
jgi:hypothetical protein